MPGLDPRRNTPRRAAGDDVEATSTSGPASSRCCATATATPTSVVPSNGSGLPGVRFCDGPRGVSLRPLDLLPVSMARGDAGIRPRGRVGEAMGAEYLPKAPTSSAACASTCCTTRRGAGRKRPTARTPATSRGLGAASSAKNAAPRHGVRQAPRAQQHGERPLQGRRHSRAMVLHEVYLPHFRRCVGGGATCVMSAYNAVNGEWCGQNRTLITDILKGTLGFDGFDITDWIYGITDAEAAANAGVDVECRSGCTTRSTCEPSSTPEPSPSPDRQRGPTAAAHDLRLAPGPPASRPVKTSSPAPTIGPWPGRSGAAIGGPRTQRARHQHAGATARRRGSASGRSDRTPRRAR